MLSYLGNDLRREVRTRPLVSVAVSGDRYSVGYSVAPEHVVSDSRLRRLLVADASACCSPAAGPSPGPGRIRAADHGPPRMEAQGRSGSGWPVRKRSAASSSMSELSASHWTARRVARASRKAYHVGSRPGCSSWS